MSARLMGAQAISFQYPVCGWCIQQKEAAGSNYLGSYIADCMRKFFVLLTKRATGPLFGFWEPPDARVKHTEMEVETKPVRGNCILQRTHTKLPRNVQGSKDFALLLALSTLSMVMRSPHEEPKSSCGQGCYDKRQHHCNAKQGTCEARGSLPRLRAKAPDTSRRSLCLNLMSFMISYAGSWRRDWGDGIWVLRPPAP